MDRNAHLAKAGVLEPAPIGAPALPAGVASHVQRVAEGFWLLFGLKCLYNGKPKATPFSWRFAAAWCGVGERQAGEAIHELLRLGVIRPAGTHKRTTLFLPRSGA